MEFIRQHALQVHNQRKELYKMYDQFPIPSGGLAQRLGVGIIEMWLELTSSADSTFKFQTHHDPAELTRTIEDQATVLIDAPALLTNFVLFGNSELFDSLPFTWVIARSTFDALQTHRRKLTTDGPRTSVGTQNAEMRRAEFTQEDIDAKLKWLDQILDWCKKHAFILHPKRRVQMTPDEHTEMLELFGQSSADTILLAQEKNGVIFSDDDHLRGYASGVFGVHAFSTFHLIEHQVKGGSIPQKKRSEMLNVLMKHNYDYVPVTATALWKSLEEGGFHLTKPFTTAVRGLCIMQPSDCAGAITTFAKKVYVELSMSPSQEQFILYALQAAKRSRSFEMVKRLLPVAIEREFIILLRQKSKFLSLIESISYHQN